MSVNTETETDFYILPENLDNASACDKVMDYSDYSVTVESSLYTGSFVFSLYMEFARYVPFPFDATYDSGRFGILYVDFN